MKKLIVIFIFFTCFSCSIQKPKSILFFDNLYWKENIEEVKEKEKLEKVDLIYDAKIYSYKSSSDVFLGKKDNKIYYYFDSFELLFSVKIIFKGKNNYKFIKEEFNDTIGKPLDSVKDEMLISKWVESYVTYILSFNNKDNEGSLFYYLNK